MQLYGSLHIQTYQDNKGFSLDHNDIFLEQ
jgi:hypothetical protein